MFIIIIIICLFFYLSLILVIPSCRRSCTEINVDLTACCETKFLFVSVQQYNYLDVALIFSMVFHNAYKI